MSKWRESRLGDHVVINAKSVDKAYPHSEINYLDTGSITRGRIESLQPFILADAPSRARRVVKENDVVVSMVRPIQRHYGFLRKVAPNMVASTGFVVLTCKDTIDPYFLYSYLSQDDVVDYLDMVAEGSTSAYPAFTPDVIENFVINLPPIAEQRAIAAVLSSLDEKIDLLHRQNKTLEDLSVVLFRKWFVEFDFPTDRDLPYKAFGGKMINSELGSIPVGWKIGIVNDLCETLASGGTPSTSVDAYWGGEINWFATRELQDCYLFQSEKKISKLGLESSSAKMFPKGSVLMAIYAAPTVGRLGILGCEASFNQATCGFVARKNVASGPFIYLLLLSLREELNGLANGAAQQNLNVRLVREFKTVIPDNRVTERFDSVVKPMFEKILNNSAQAQALTAFKNLLLPKLMSGEVGV